MFIYYSCFTGILLVGYWTFIYIYIYSYWFTGPFVGWLLDRFTIRQVTLCGALVASCGFVISTFAQSVEVLIITYGIVGGNLITRITQIIFDIATRLQAPI